MIILFLIIGAGIGYLVGHFYVVTVIGGIAGIVLSLAAQKKSLPPEVRIASTPKPQPVSQPPLPGSVKERLAQLEKLKAEGLISEGEYAEKRQTILSVL